MLDTTKQVLGIDVLEDYWDEDGISIYTSVTRVIAGLAVVERLRQYDLEIVSRAAAMVGVELAAFTGLGAAGVSPFEDGSKMMLIYLAGYWCNHGAQKMIRIDNLSEEKVRSFCLEAPKTEGGGACREIIIYYGPKRFAVAGTLKAASLTRELSRRAGAEIEPSGDCGWCTRLAQPAQPIIEAGWEQALKLFDRCAVQASVRAISPTNAFWSTFFRLD